MLGLRNRLRRDFCTASTFNYTRITVILITNSLTQSLSGKMYTYHVCFVEIFAQIAISRVSLIKLTRPDDYTMTDGYVIVFIHDDISV